MSKPLKHVIVGVGAGVLGMHRPALELEAVHVVGVSDINAEAGRARAEAFACPFFADYTAMLRETAPDVAVVLTPHPFHAAVAAACLEAGAHVLVEKPMAVEVGEADAMIQAAQRSGRLLAVNFQHRFRPEVRAARRLIEEGRLGKLQHVDMAVSWPRTASYFKAASWRGTWVGEGGGVLMNQAPHNLDLLCYLLGLPERVVAWTRTTLHAIETEDTVQAMLEWGPSEVGTGVGGALGSLHISTAEAGRPERLEIVGTGGTLEIAQGRLTLNRCETDFRSFMLESENPFGTPTFEVEAVALEAGAGDHAAVYRNLHEAILAGAPLVCDGVEGRKSLELANAMILSSHTRRELTLPIDRPAYAALLADLKASSVAVR
jgi:predicted dehydrogenase